MEKQKEFLIYPENEKEVINFIVKKGVKNILVIGLNPREDNNLNLLEDLAYKNGFHGWVLTFLYPKRNNDVAFLEMEKDEIIFWENLNLINLIISKNQFNFTSVLLVWGNQIESFNQTYLKESACYIYRNLEKYNLKYFCVGIDKHGNPLPVSKAIKLKTFDFKSYALKLKKTVKIKPLISLNGYEIK